MAKQQQKDLLTRLADAGEETIQRLSKAPGGENVLKALNTTRDRLDELQKRIRGLDELQRRVATLEKRVDGLAKKLASTPKAGAGKPPKDDGA